VEQTERFIVNGPQPDVKRDEFLTQTTEEILGKNKFKYRNIKNTIKCAFLFLTNEKWKTKEL
jgi:hypothetical protein